MLDSVRELKHRLQQQEELHHLVSLMLNRFLTTSSQDFSIRVQQSLAELGTYFQVDRVYVFDYDFTNQVCHNTFEWCAEGITTEMDNLQNVPIDALPEWVNTHVAGETMYIPSVRDLPLDSGIRKILEPQMIQSLLAVPMMQGDICRGFVGFDSVVSERLYTGYEQRVLKDFSNALLGAVERHRIEEQRQVIYEELIEAKREADRANLAKSEFLSNMSHEIRTPLNAILGFSHLLEREDLKGKVASRIRDIIQNGEHLLILINEILDMSKIESGHVHVKTECVYLSKMMYDIKRMFDVMADEKGIQLKLEMDSSVPSHIRSDGIKLKQIIINLLQNALKFTEHGMIHIKLDTSSEKLMICVSDTGRGIHEQDAALLFEPFYQKKYSDQLQGTGLGLPISKKYAQLLGGDLYLNSTIGIGSEFCLTVPLVLDDSLSSSTHSNEEWGDDETLGKDILVIEDTPAQQEILKELLLIAGCRVDVATTGMMALEMVRNHHYDLVLLDIRLPDTTGFKVATELKRSRSCPTIIFLSANAFEDDRQQAYAAGADGFLAKPFHPWQLFDAIRNIGCIPENMSSESHKRILMLQKAIVKGDVSQIKQLAIELHQNVPKRTAIINAIDQFDYASANRLLEYGLRKEFS